MTCAWHDRGDESRESRWVVEVHGADGEIRQRLGACDSCAKAVFKSMRWEPPMKGDSYPTIRRALSSDSVLHFDDLAPAD